MTENRFIVKEGKKAFVVSETVEKIDAECFKDSDVEEIIFSNTIRELGDSAFENCKMLKSITLPDSLERIGKY